MEQPRTPERLRELIDEALEEIERTELEMLDLLADVLGPEDAQRIADQIAAQADAPRMRRLLSDARSRPANTQRPNPEP